MDAAQLLKPLLARGVLRLIGATTLDEYRKHIEKDGAMERRFQQVFVSQPSVEATISILRGIAPKYEAHHGVRISDRALVAAAQMSDRYITQVGSGEVQPMFNIFNVKWAVLLFPLILALYIQSTQRLLMPLPAFPSRQGD